MSRDDISFVKHPMLTRPYKISSNRLKHKWVSPHPFGKKVCSSQLFPSTKDVSQVVLCMPKETLELASFIIEEQQFHSEFSQDDQAFTYQSPRPSLPMVLKKLM